jgi:hypothetical protein
VMLLQLDQHQVDVAEMLRLGRAVDEDIVKKMSTNHRRNGRRVPFMSDWKVDDMFVGLNGMTRNSKSPWWVQNVIFSTSVSCICT